MKTGLGKMCINALLPMIFIMALAMPTQSAQAGTLCVNPGGTDGCFGSIQAAIDAAADGDMINIADGTYDGTLNLEGRTNLIITGAGAATTIVQPSAVIGWNANGHTTDRTTAIRMVGSSNIAISGLTIDLQLVSANGVYAALVSDSTGSLSNNIFKNNVIPESSGGYTEGGVYLIASGFTPAARAAVSVENNTFADIGRVSLLIHDYVEATITGNSIYRTVHDFGYGIELGSAASGTISGNSFYGFDTPALSDGSNSAGIYIENAFTWDITSPIAKNVTISSNDIYGNQWGLYMGNEFDTYAGDVDIVATVSGNNIHNNVDGGVYVADEDKAAGSSMTATFTNNTLANNGGYGYYLTTQGDGSLTVDIEGGSITGHGVGVYLSDTAAGASASDYSVIVEDATITGNSSYGIQNTYSGVTIDASPNWWGSANPDWGALIDGLVTYNPWYNSDSITTQTYAVGADAAYTTIQGAINAAAAWDTVQVAAGTYVEQLVIGKSLTLLGPNADINPNTGVRVAEAILLPATLGPFYFGPGPCTKLIQLTGSVNGVTIKGFTVDGSNPALPGGVGVNSVEVDACQGISGKDAISLANIVVENNIVQNFVHAGIYLRNLSSAYSTSGNYIRYNKIDNLGNIGNPYGFGIIVQYNYYADITDNVITRARTGIETSTYNSVNPGTTGSISNNTVNAWRTGIFHYHWSNTASSISVDHNTITPMAHDQEVSGLGWWNGILLGEFGTDGSTTVVDNTISVAPGFTFTETSYSAGYNVISDSATIPLTINGGTVTGADYGVFVNNYDGYPEPDLYSDPTSIVIDGVTIQDSGIAGVYVKDNALNTTGATVFAKVQNSIIDSAGSGILVEGIKASAQANHNQISGNPTAGVTNPNATMDAQNNWWGNPSGPSGEGPGSGDAVSLNVDYLPWCTDAACNNSTPFATTTSIYDDLPDPAPVGNNIAIKFRVANNVAGGPVPAGTIDLTLNGTTAICSDVVLDALGEGVCTYTFNTAAIFTLAATFTPDNTDYFMASSGTATHAAVPYATTTSIYEDLPDPSSIGNNIAIKFRVTNNIAGGPVPAGTIDLTLNGTTAICSDVVLDSLGEGSCTRKFNTAGKFTLAATFTPDNTDYFTASSGTATHTAVNKPVLLLPANYAQILYNRPSFDWMNLRGATMYRIQVARDPKFTRILINAKTTASKYTSSIMLPANVTLYWRVRRENLPYSAWSTTFSFTTANPPGVPLLKLPLNLASLTDHTPTLTWSISVLPAGTVFGYYELQVYTNASSPASSTVLDEQILERTNPQYTFASSLPADTYYWHVRSFNSDGEYSKWSSARSFIIR